MIAETKREYAQIELAATPQSRPDPVLRQHSAVQEPDALGGVVPGPAIDLRRRRYLLWRSHPENDHKLVVSTSVSATTPTRSMPHWQSAIRIWPIL